MEYGYVVNHTLIDKNPDEYPVEELLKWKMIVNMNKNDV